MMTRRWLAPRARGKLMRTIVKARDAGATVVFDTNLRPALWTSPRIMASTLTAAASIADIVLPTHTDEALGYALGSGRNRVRGPGQRHRTAQQHGATVDQRPHGATGSSNGTAGRSSAL